MNFSFDWFTPNIPNLEQHLRCFADKECHALEIGCFEGRSTLWFLENILTHPNSTITAIDSFTGSAERAAAGIDFSSTRLRFVENIEPFVEKVVLYENRSLIALSLLQGSGFDFIYVDGSHNSKDVIVDAVLGWALLKPSGIMVFDDYLWGDGTRTSPKPAIDAFLDIYYDSLEVIHKSYQVFVKKL